LADQITVSSCAVRNTATNSVSHTPDELSVMANGTTISRDIRERSSVTERTLFITPHAEHEGNNVVSDGSHSDVFTDWVTRVFEVSTGSKIIRPGLSSNSKIVRPSKISETNTSSFDVVEVQKEVLGIGINS